MTKFVNKQIGELFTFDSSKCIYHAIDLPIIKLKPEKGYYRYVVRSAENNGIKGYIKKPTSGLNPGNTISCAQDTAEFFYQSEPYFTGNKVKVMNPIGFKLTQQIALYLLTVIKQGFQIFGWGSSYNVDVMKKVKIQVPVTATGALDTDYMVSYVRKIEASYVRKIEASYVRKIEAYLSVLGYKSMADVKLTDHEQKLLAGGIQAQPTSKFRVGDFYQICPISIKYDSTQLTEKGTTPVYSAIETKYGVFGYTNDDAQFDITKKDYLIFGDHTRTMRFPNKSFSVADNTKVLSSKVNMNQKQKLFLITAWYRAIPNLGYARHWSIAQKAKFILPVTSSGDPDWQFMEDYITAIEKLKVLKLKQFLDHKLDLYKQAIK